MRIHLLLLALFLYSCGGSLSDDQRKKLRENMEDGEIRKVTDAELTEAAFAYGRSIAAIMEARDQSLSDTRLMDSLNDVYHVKVVSLVAGDSLLLEIENQIIEAYTSGAGELELADNIQKLGPDSLLYTKPLMRELPDGTVEFARALGIRMPRKYVVRSIKE